MSTAALSFYVPGLPAPGGSKRFVGFGKKTGRAILIDAAGERNKNWRASVAQVAAGEIAGRDLFTGPLKVRFEFVMPRPKGHLNSKGRVKPSAPAYPITKPDALKLARSTEDALTGVVWNDDAQVVIGQQDKRFAAPGEGTGAHVTITALS